MVCCGAGRGWGGGAQALSAPGREPASPDGRSHPSLHCFACLVGMGELENVFLLKTIHFNLSHSWKNHNPPSSLPGLQF